MTMIEVGHFQTYGWESAVRGMRNPMNSWDKSDSHQCVVTDGQCPKGDKCYLYDSIKGCALGLGGYVLGENDLGLMKRLCSTHSADDRKFLRQIFVTCDITAPLYWWKEMDQYKVGTVTNSCSTMHKISSKRFVLSDFSVEHLTANPVWTNYNGDDAYSDSPIENFRRTIAMLNTLREAYLETKSKDVWWQMIQLLPSSYNQKRTWSANYEVLHNIYHARKNHKLDEWREFCKIIEGLPYAKELICE